MKQLTYLLIIVLSGLILRTLLRVNLVEGLSSCTPDKQNLVYQNTAAIEQQQKDMDDYEASVEKTIEYLQTEVTAFSTLISQNASNIAENKEEIESSAKMIKTAADKKGAELDKIAF